MEQVDPITQQTYEEPHSRLNNLTQLLEDKASVQTGKLEGLVADWGDLHEQLQDMKVGVLVRVGAGGWTGGAPGR